MTTFTVHDEEGRITQSNKIYIETDYAKALNNHGFDKFVQSAHDRPLDTYQKYVHNGDLCDRPQMQIVVDRTRIRAGGNDAAKFSGIIPGTKATVWTSGINIGSEMIPVDKMELPIPVPCVYRVVFEKWPYKDLVIEVEAVS